MIVIPMAGASRRFLEAGYEVPKFMLDAHGRSLFEWSVGSFSAYFGKERLLLIYREGPEQSATLLFIQNRCERMGLSRSDYALVELAEPTSGQAETVQRGIDTLGVPDDEPITIFNIDSIRPNFRYPRFDSVQTPDAYLEVFRGDGTHWSFVRPMAPESHRVAEVTEKIRISDLCSTGLYWFRRAGFFREAYEPMSNVDARSLQGGERYVAPLYNYLIASGRDVRYELIGSDEVIFSGTPTEYEAFCLSHFDAERCPQG